MSTYAELITKLPARPDTMDVIPVKHESIRKSPPDAANLQRCFQEPTMAGYVPVFASKDHMLMGDLALNLLMVRRWPEASKCLRRPARDVRYPCEVHRAHLLVTPGLGYQKHRDINSRVMLTGVACLAYEALGDRDQAKRDLFRTAELAPMEGYDPEVVEKLKEYGFDAKVRKY